MKKKIIKRYPPTKGSQRKKEDAIKSNYDLFGLAIIVLLGIIVYSNSFGCSFHFDDFTSIVDNPQIRNLSDLKTWWNYSPNRFVAYYSFALNYHFHQLDVWGYHLVNLVVHLINACLVWWLTLLIFSSPVLKDYKIAEHKKLLAFVTALLFVSHPLATQSVTYIVQRITSMVAMFYFLSLALYIKARLSDNEKTLRILLFAGSFISAALAMFTKQNAFTLPFAIILVEFFFIRTNKLTINFKDYRVILLMAAFLGMILIIPLTNSLGVLNPLPPSYGRTYTLTPLNYLLTQFSVIVKYIQLLILPVNQMVDYDFPIAENFFGIRTLLCFLVLLFLIALAIFLFNRNRIISFGIFWLFLTLSVESSIIPINDVIFEHRTYLPSFGFFLILSSGIFYLSREKNKFWAIAVFLIIAVSNSYLTYERNKAWKNEMTLWSDNTIKAPNCARSLFNRAHAYEGAQEWDKAIADYSRVIEISPNYENVYYNRGHAYEASKKWEEALIDYSRSIEIDPKHVKAYNNRGNAYGNLKQWDKALADYSKAIEIDSNFVDAYNNLGVAYGNLGQWNKAIEAFTDAHRIDPTCTVAVTNRVIASQNVKKQ